MKKYIKLILTICLSLCMVLCLGLAVACQPAENGDNTFTITVVNEDGTPAKAPEDKDAPKLLQYCAEGGPDSGLCIPANPDSKGQVKVDLTENMWKNAESMHITFVNLPDGYKAYDENNKSYGFGEGPYIDFHKVKSVKFTLKEESDTPVIEAEDVYQGYQYDIDSLVAGESKSYSTFVSTSKAYLDVDVDGGEFDLSVKIGNATPVIDTLTETNSHVLLEIGSVGPTGTSVILTVTPKNSNSTHLTFAICPVYNIGGEDVRILANIISGASPAVYLDVYKVYFTLNENAELAFSDPLGNGFSAIDGYPIKVTIGDYEATWTEASDILSISALNSGDVAVTFEFDDPDTANLALLVKDANVSSDDVITLDKEFTVEVGLDNFNWLIEPEYTFTVPADGAYYIIVDNASAATVRFDVKGAYSETYYSSENGGSLAVAITYTEYVFDDNWTITDTIPHLTLKAGDVVTITFSTENTKGDTYTAKVTADLGARVPSNPHNDENTDGEPIYIDLDQQFGGEIEAGEEKIYWLGLFDYGDGIPQKLILSIDDIEGEFELTYKIGENDAQTQTITATKTIELDLSNEEVGFMGLDIVITVTTVNGGTVHFTISAQE